MKKVLVGMMMVSSMMFAGSAMAASAQQNTGCGLGAVLIGDKASDSLIGQLAMTFLNAISGNQTFGITSGTSECKMPSKIVQDERVKEFVVANLDNLAKDIASGKGETLDTLADLMSVSSDQRTVVYAKLQTNFDAIFTSTDVEATQVLDRMMMIVIQG
jgi:hypothetical protein